MERVIRGFLVVSVTAFVSLAAPRVRACGDEWEPAHVDPFPAGVSMAEKQLDVGDTLAAAATVVRMYPHIQSLTPKQGPLVARALRVLSVATARADGVLSIDRELPAALRGKWSSGNDRERGDRLAWAATTLRSLHEAKKEDPTTQSELGEVLARLPDGAAEARALLGDLADRDLLGSAEGYAALARLRASAGDVSGRDAAAKRCEAIAKDARVCVTDVEAAG